MVMVRTVQNSDRKPANQDSPFSLRIARHNYNIKLNVEYVKLPTLLDVNLRSSERSELSASASQVKKVCHTGRKKNKLCAISGNVRSLNSFYSGL